MSDRDELKRKAAEAALAFLPERGVIGLGTGSTAMHAIRLIGERIAAGGEKRRADLVGVATSQATAAAAAALGISLLDAGGPWQVDVTFDGADEVSPVLDLIKGGGGALLREKIVNAASKLNVIMADDSKLVGSLGEHFRLPVEVVRYGWQQTRQAVEAIAGPAQRRERDGGPFITENGNYILDVATGPIADPKGLERDLELTPGVVVSGLFVDRANVVVIAGAGSVEIRRRPADS
jgi:ribose 5-phosphate isomerase A